MFKRTMSVLFVCLIAFATIAQANNVVGWQYLKDSTNGNWNSMSIATSSSATSTAVFIDSSAGYAKLDITNTGTGTLGIIYQLSEDAVNWHVPHDTDGNALNSIASSLSGSRAIVFQPAIGKWMRVIATSSTADSTVTMKLITKESW